MVQSLDPNFGMRGSTTAHVSGFGGWPLGIMVGIDGRPTLVCSSPAQSPADSDAVLTGARFRRPKISTIRITSFPPDGRPVPIGSTARRAAVFGPNANEPFRAVRAITQPDRIAVLGGVIQANREVPTLLIFEAGPSVQGVAGWALSRTISLSNLDVSANVCGLGWDGTDVVVVAPSLIRTALRLRIHATRTGRKTTVNLRMPPLDLPVGSDVSVRASAVSRDVDESFAVGLTWEARAAAPPGQFQPIGVFQEARASVVRLVIGGGGAFSADPAFGTTGIWVSSAPDGEITTADHVTHGPAAGLLVVGRAGRAGSPSIFAARLVSLSGEVVWTSYPAAGVLPRPASIALDSQDQLLICGSTREWDQNFPVNPADAVVVRLETEFGQPDASFGVGGVARFALHGGTHGNAVAVTDAGEPLVASAVAWGSSATTAAFHPCLSRLTPTGALDQAFGWAGMARHDGLGAANLVAISPSGRPWSAGLTASYLGETPTGPDLVPTLTVAQLGLGGELQNAFGLDGLSTLQLPATIGEGDVFELNSLVPLADGRAVLTGRAFRRRVGEISLDLRGTWVLRLGSNGRLDTTFGDSVPPTGVRFYPLRSFALITELNDGQGSLQGFEGANSIRLTGDGSLDVSFGPNGVVANPKATIHDPHRIEPTGEWFAPVYGRVTEVGLVRCLPNGTVDTAFGAGGTATDCFVELESMLRGINKVRALLLDDGGRHRTLRLADGTFLTLWTITWQESVTVFNSSGSTRTLWQTAGLLLLAWDVNGKPRGVTAWQGSPARVIRNPEATLLNWLGWRYRCSVVEANGAIVVGLTGEDLNATPSFAQPPTHVSKVTYFCRLIPPNFDLDPTFGTNGHITTRLPGGDFLLKSNFPGGEGRMAEDQAPEDVALVGTNQVVASIVCTHPHPIFGGVYLDSPFLPLDGSVGMARLV